MENNNFNSNKVDLETGGVIASVDLNGEVKTLESYMNGPDLEPVAVHMEGSEISLIQLKDGSVIDKHQAVELCKAGKIPSCDVSVSKFGEEYLRSRNDGDPSNNLSELPKF